MSTRVITLGSGRQVTLRQYLDAVKYAKENPDVEFNEGLTCWWPCKGREIMRQFFEGVQDRINEDLPYSARGLCKPR